MKDVNIYIYTEYTGSLKSGTGKYHVILETMVTVDGKEIPWTTPDIDVLEDITRNRLELVALDKALSHMTKPSRITVYTSSDFITGAFAQDWPEKWQQNDFKKKGKPIKHADLWKSIMEQMEQHDITFMKATTTPYMKVQASELKNFKEK